MDELLASTKALKKEHQSADWWATLKVVTMVVQTELKMAVKKDAPKAVRMAEV